MSNVSRESYPSNTHILQFAVHPSSSPAVLTPYPRSSAPRRRAPCPRVHSATCFRYCSYKMRLVQSPSRWQEPRCLLFHLCELVALDSPKTVWNDYPPQLPRSRFPRCQLSSSVVGLTTKLSISVPKRAILQPFL